MEKWQRFRMFLKHEKLMQRTSHQTNFALPPKRKTCDYSNNENPKKGKEKTYGFFL